MALILEFKDYMEVREALAEMQMIQEVSFGEFLSSPLKVMYTKLFGRTTKKLNDLIGDTSMDKAINSKTGDFADDFKEMILDTKDMELLVKNVKAKFNNRGQFLMQQLDLAKDKFMQQDLNKELSVADTTMKAEAGKEKDTAKKEIIGAGGAMAERIKTFTDAWLAASKTLKESNQKQINALLTSYPKNKYPNVHADAAKRQALADTIVTLFVYHIAKDRLKLDNVVDLQNKMKDSWKKTIENTAALNTALQQISDKQKEQPAAPGKTEAAAPAEPGKEEASAPGKTEAAAPAEPGKEEASAPAEPGKPEKKPGASKATK